MSAGRPSEYTPEIAAAICERIVAGESVNRICRDEDMPDKSTVYRWLARHEDFSDKYVRAKAQQADMMSEELLEIADDGTNDTYVDEDGLPRTNHDVIARSKLRVDARKWLMSKLLPKKYGDKLELSGNKDAPLTVQVVRLSDANDPAPR
jgi:transposase-like protein